MLFDFVYTEEEIYIGELTFWGISNENFNTGKNIRNHHICSAAVFLSYAWLCFGKNGF